MAFDIEQFRQTVATVPASPAYFEFTIADPPVSLNGDKTVRDLKLLCQTTSLPGRSLGNAQARRNGIARVSIPYGMLDDGVVNATFIVTEGMETHSFFNRWLLLSGNKDNTEQPSYLDDIASTVQIAHFTAQGEIDRKVELRDAYPTQLSAVELDWSQTDSYIQLQIEFTYTQWFDIT